MKYMKRKWKKGDVIVPRIDKAPKRNLIVTILEVRKSGYYVDTNGKSKEEIEHKYLEDSYISENGSRVYTWILKTRKGEKDVKATDSYSDKRTRGTKQRKTTSNDNIQENSHNGSVRNRSRRAPRSSCKRKKAGKQP